jgi:PAS domain S-box-containing protein
MNRAPAVLLEQEDNTATSRIYEALLQATPDLSYVFDLQHRFIFANKALLDMWGMRPEDALGKTCLELGYEPWHAAMHDAEIEQVIATRLPVRGDVQFPHATEGRRTYDYIFTPVFGPDGQVEAIAGSTRDVTERKRHEEHLQLLVNELNHRVKNTLAMVQSIARQTFRTAAGADDASEKIEERLLALSRAHDVLTRENWHSVDLTELVQAAAALYGDGGPRFEVHGDACRLDPRRALALAMALHELGANALKHGALSAPEGRVCVQWQCALVEGRPVIELVWQERGGPPVQPPRQRGFGARLLERGLKHDLGGEVDLAFEPAGLRYRVSMPPADEALEVY